MCVCVRACVRVCMCVCVSKDLFPSGCYQVEASSALVPTLWDLIFVTAEEIVSASARIPLMLRCTQMGRSALPSELSGVVDIALVCRCVSMVVQHLTTCARSRPHLRMATRSRMAASVGLLCHAQDTGSEETISSLLLSLRGRFVA